jgi:UDP-3-O-[3-hydroxymyristoyl] glucosamine N-acyltransferase
MALEITSSDAQFLAYNAANSDNSAASALLEDAYGLAEKSIQAIEKHPFKTFTYIGAAAATAYFARKSIASLLYSVGDTPPNQLFKLFTNQPIVKPATRLTSRLPDFLLDNQEPMEEKLRVAYDPQATITKTFSLLIDSSKDLSRDSPRDFPGTKDLEATYRYKRSSRIDKTAIIAGDVVIGKNVSIGFDVEIGEGVVIGDDVTIAAGTKIGAGSYIAKRSKLGVDVRIGKNVKFLDSSFPYEKTVIDDSATIGDDSLIGPACHLGKDVRVGENCRLEEKVTILDYSVLHRGVEIGAATLIRREGFIGEMSTIGSDAQLGQNTLLGRNVHIGDRVTTWGIRFRQTRSIQRGVIIEDGTTIGSASEIRSRIGKDSVIGPRSEIIGEIGANVQAAADVYVGPTATVGDHAKLGAAAKVAKGIHRFVRVPAWSVVEAHSIYPPPDA